MKVIYFYSSLLNQLKQKHNELKASQTGEHANDDDQADDDEQANDETRATSVVTHGSFGSAVCSR